jgi:predicted MFS family arabinose efflux permease
MRGGAERLDRTVGGPARRNAVLALAFVLSLDSADQGAIGAVAPYLEPSLRISNFRLGLLVTMTSLVGVVFTVPMGVLTDRFNRTRLLMVMVTLWGAAELASAFATSFWWLVVFRVALGGVTAVAAPAVASLTGDYFPPGDRGRIYGTVVAGELLGAGFGVLVAGEISAFAGWRPALGILALPSIGLVYVLHRLPEPARGGQSWIPRGAETIASAEDVERGERPEGAGDPVQSPAASGAAGGGPNSGGAPGTSAAADVPGTEQPGGRAAAGQAASRDGEHGSDRENGAGENDEVRENDVLEKVEEQGFEPEEAIVLDESPAELSLRGAVRYVLKVRTNVVIIVTSSLGYFFFAGLKVFALLFVRGHFQISQGVATILVLVVGAAALAGVILGGRASDKLIGKGRVTARIDIGILGYVVAALLLAPAIVMTNIGFSLVLIMIAAAGIAAPNATLDAARLDIMPSQLWGRAESVRTVVRTTLEAFAPLVFGFLSDFFGGKQSAGFGVAASGTKAPASSPAAVAGLGDAFLVMLVPLAVSGIALIWARRAYPVDVASAGETQRRMTEAQQREASAASADHAAGDEGAASPARQGARRGGLVRAAVSRLHLEDRGEAGFAAGRAGRQDGGRAPSAGRRGGSPGAAEPAAQGDHDHELPRAAGDG